MWKVCLAGTDLGFAGAAVHLGWQAACGGSWVCWARRRPSRRSCRCCRSCCACAGGQEEGNPARGRDPPTRPRCCPGRWPPCPGRAGGRQGEGEGRPVDARSPAPLPRDSNSCPLQLGTVCDTPAPPALAWRCRWRRGRLWLPPRATSCWAWRPAAATAVRAGRPSLLRCTPLQIPPDWLRSEGGNWSGGPPHRRSGALGDPPQRPGPPATKPATAPAQPPNTLWPHDGGSST